MQTLWRDVQFGARLLWRRPGFTLVAALTLGLGVGATTAVFGVANWLLIRPLPGVSGSDELITVEFGTENPGQRTGISPQNLADLDGAATTLRGMAGWQPQTLQVMGPGGEPLEITGEAVGGDYFGVLGVRPGLGRLLDPSESQPGQPAFVAVISGALWRSLYGGDPEVIGKVLRVNRHALSIVGVVGDDFRGAERRGRSDVWFPSSIYGQLRHFSDLERLNSRRAGIFNAGVIARLAPGATPEAAQAQLGQIMDRLIDTYPEDNRIYSEYRPRVLAGAGLSRLTRDYLEETIRLLFVVVLVVLVIACANVANMLLSRGVERRGEAAVRRALGATGSRLMRQQLAEGVLLSLAGGAIGLVIALLFRAIFRGAQLWYFELEGAPFDGRVFGFALLAAVSTGVLFGLIPTALTRRADLTGSLREAGRRTTAGRTRVRSAIAVVQLSLSVALLVGALLLTRTMLNLGRVDVGFDPDDVYAFTISTSPQGYRLPQRTAFERALLDRLNGISGIQAAGLSVNAPFNRVSFTSVIQHPTAAERAVDVMTDWISPGYFETLRNPVLEGRALRAEDLGSSGATNVVISRALGRDLFGSAPAIGRTMIEGRRDPRELRIVGVVADRRGMDLTSGPDLVLYEPVDASSRISDWIVALVRTPLGLREAEALVRCAVDALDPALPLTQVEPLADKLERSVSEQRLVARVVVALAVIALVMAAIGLYGVITWSIAERTHEIGIRMALGAQARRVLLMVVEQAGALIVMGALLGIAGAVALSRVIENQLFGVERFDAAVYVFAAALFALVGLAAAVAPTRRATRVDPLIALRHD